VRTRKIINPRLNEPQVGLLKDSVLDESDVNLMERIERLPLDRIKFAIAGQKGGRGDLRVEIADERVLIPTMLYDCWSERDLALLSAHYPFGNERAPDIGSIRRTNAPS
jgi:hypothetical protein